MKKIKKEVNNKREKPKQQQIKELRVQKTDELYIKIIAQWRWKIEEPAMSAPRGERDTGLRANLRPLTLSFLTDKIKEIKYYSINIIDIILHCAAG